RTLVPERGNRRLRARRQQMGLRRRLIRSQPAESSMADRPRKVLFPNPFYVLLLVASSVFTITALGYLIGPSIEQRALDHPGAGPGRPGPGSLVLSAWLDRNGPVVLAVEIGVMFVAGVLAMLTDRWFPSRPGGPTDGASGREA